MKTKKNVILYGLGGLFKKHRDFLLDEYNIVAVTDTNTNKRINIDIPSIRPLDILTTDFEVCIIVVDSLFVFLEIRESLLNIGVPESKIEKFSTYRPEFLPSPPEVSIIIHGDRKRAHISATAYMCNTLLNTVSGDIWVGDYTFTSHNVCLITGTHDISKRGVERIIKVPSEGRDIRIGDGVWLCSNVTVLGDVVIDDNAVVAAGSVVVSGTKIPANEVWGGVPAKKIKMIQEEHR